jgi:VWFA-related protein
VLREAIDRLHVKRTSEAPAMEVPISEVDANLVANHRDVGLFNYLVEATAKQYQTDAFNAYLIVKQRLRQINSQSRIVEMQTLLGLESLMRSSLPLVGRKLVFFISDGFIVDVKKSSAPDILRRVVNEAARVGAVVYTMDTRAIFSDPHVDAGRNDYPDFSSRQAGRNLAETKTPQAILETLAEDTGGRSFLNPNDFDDSLALAIRETSDYYLLDWRPDTESQRAGKSRLEVVVKGRPELRVRLRRHIFNLKPEETTTAAKKATDQATTPEDELRATLGSLYPHRELPTSLSVGYVRTVTGGPTLNVSMQLDGLALNFGESGESREGASDEKPLTRTQSEVDVVGVALDDRGSFSSFKQKLTVPRETVFGRAEHFVQWNQSLPLPPGLYQVRVAVRERDTGRTGSAMQWIEIPKIDPNSFAMSDIFIGERKMAEASTLQRIAVKVNRSFVRNSFLRYQTYLYNAAHAGNPSQLKLEVKVLRGNRTVFTVPESKLGSANANDPTSFPLSGEISLDQFPPGQYILQVSATERGAKSGVTQRAVFAIE